MDYVGQMMSPSEHLAGEGGEGAGAVEVDEWDWGQEGDGGEGVWAGEGGDGGRGVGGVVSPGGHEGMLGSLSRMESSLHQKLQACRTHTSVHKGDHSTSPH